MWWHLIVSVLATNRSCLLVRKLLRFVGFHRQPSLDLVRGLLYLKVCKSLSASGIEMKITTFLICFVFSHALFFGGQKIFSVSCVIGWRRSQSQHIAALALHPLAKVQRVRLFFEHAGFCCEDWGLLVSIHVHRALLCVLLTHVWKPAFSDRWCKVTPYMYL